MENDWLYEFQKYIKQFTILIILIIVTISYAGYNLFIKLASSQNLNNSNSIAATLCLQLFALFVTILFSFYLFSKGEKIFVLPSKSYLYAIFAGISIGLAEIGYFYLFNESNPKGASNANSVIPVILGGTILITMIFSVGQCTLLQSLHLQKKGKLSKP